MLFAHHLDPDQAIENFLEVLSSEPADDPHRLTDAGSFVALAVGGEPTYFTPLEGEPPPGTILAAIHAEGTTVSNSEWIALLRSRLHEVVNAGVDPLFLMRSIAYYVADWYRSLADTGRADNSRANSREDMLAIAEDPSRLSAYRLRLIEQDPKYGEQSDEEIANGLRRLADKLAPVSPEEAVDHWSKLQAWERDSAQILAL